MEFMTPYNLTRFPGPLEDKQAHNITDPPPTLTVSLGFFSCQKAPFSFHQTTEDDFSQSLRSFWHSTATFENDRKDFSPTCFLLNFEIVLFIVVFFSFCFFGEISQLPDNKWYSATITVNMWKYLVYVETVSKVAIDFWFPPVMKFEANSVFTSQKREKLMTIHEDRATWSAINLFSKVSSLQLCVFKAKYNMRFCSASEMCSCTACKNSKHWIESINPSKTEENTDVWWKMGLTQASKNERYEPSFIIWKFQITGNIGKMIAEQATA